MPWSEGVQPLRMQRVAVVAPARRERDVLVRLADAGVAELDRPEARDQAAGGAAAPATALLLQLPDTAALQPRLAATAPDLAALVAAGRADLVAGEAQLESYLAAGGAPAPGDRVGRLGAVGRARRAGRRPGPGRRRPGAAPPAARGGPAHDAPARRAGAPLDVTARRDLRDRALPRRRPDAARGPGLRLDVRDDVRRRRPRRPAGARRYRARPAAGRVGWARFRKVWPFVVGAGAAAAFFGLLYGEFFGPTGVVPVLWLSPLEEPVTLLTAALGVGAVLLAGAYVVGAVNRWREGGWPLALVAASGIAGAALFAGLGLVLLGVDAALALAGGPGGRHGAGRGGAGLRRVPRQRRGQRRPASRRRRSSCSTWCCGSGPTWCPSPGSRPSA